MPNGILNNPENCLKILSHLQESLTLAPDGSERDEDDFEAKRARHSDRVAVAYSADGSEIDANKLHGLFKAGSRSTQGDVGSSDGGNNKNGTPTSTKITGNAVPLPRGKQRKTTRVLKQETERDEAAMEKLNETYSRLNLFRTEKVTPSRVYSIAVHPTVDKELVFVGDKIGVLGICDCSVPMSEEEAETGEGSSSTYTIDAHPGSKASKNSISCIKVSPQDPYTVSFLYT